MRRISAWSALGYQSWDDYCDKEFGSSRLRLPREERAEVVTSLRESGFSLRAIQATTGISKSTVIKDLRWSPELTRTRCCEVVQNAPPEVISEPFEPQPIPTTGLDGKTYRRKPPTPNNPTPTEGRKAFRDRFGAAVGKLDESLGRLERYELTEEFATSTSQLAKHRAHLLGLRNRLDDLLAKLSDGATS